MDTSLLLYVCEVSLRELVPTPFGASLSRMLVTVLHLWVFYQDSYLDRNSTGFVLFSFPLLALRAHPSTPKVFSKDVLDKCKRY